MTMEGRMTVCNMSIEMGARGGMISPDKKTNDDDVDSLSSLDESDFPNGLSAKNFNAIDLLIIMLRRRYKRQLKINRSKRWLMHRSSSLVSADSMSKLGKTFALKRCENPMIFRIKRFSLDSSQF